MSLTSRASALVALAAQLDTPDLFFLVNWMLDMHDKGKRVWVVQPKRTGTGPLVVVGREAASPLR